jgi:hypothetical protein
MGGRTGRSGSGGGSGGAILLEATEVDLRGVLAANGAPGSGAGRAPDASSTSTPTPGSNLGGGLGSAGTVLDGGDGVVPPDTADPYPAGGGGGVGRIRINASGEPRLAASALLTPATDTPCTTFGALP